MAYASLWDRQREVVREEIIQASLRLFLHQGFDATTIDQIVNEVGVSRRSFFRYFGTKEDVVLGDLVSRGEVIAAELAKRPVEEDPWSALRNAFHESQEIIRGEQSSELAFGRMLFDTPSLRARFLEKQSRWQSLFVPLIASRLSPRSEGTNVRATAIVAAALACLDAASEAWIAADGDATLSDLYDEAVAAVRQ